MIQLIQHLSDILTQLEKRNKVCIKSPYTSISASSAVLTVHGLLIQTLNVSCTSQKKKHCLSIGNSLFSPYDINIIQSGHASVQPSGLVARISKLSHQTSSRPEQYICWSTNAKLSKSAGPGFRSSVSLSLTISNAGPLDLATEHSSCQFVLSTMLGIHSRT